MDNCQFAVIDGKRVTTFPTLRVHKARKSDGLPLCGTPPRNWNSLRWVVITTKLPVDCQRCKYYW